MYFWFISLVTIIMCFELELVLSLKSSTGLNDELEQKVPCIECIKCGFPNPHEFKVDQLLPLIADHKLINSSYKPQHFKI